LNLIWHNSRTYLGYSLTHNFNKDALQSINIKLEHLFDGKFGPDDKPFLNQLFHQYPISKPLIGILQNHPALEIPLSQVDKAGRTLLI